MAHGIWETLVPSFKSDSSKIAWVCRTKNEGTITYSYGEIHDSVLSTAGRLRQQEISQGDVVALIGPNSPHWGIGALAVMKLGAILSPVHIGNSADDIRQQLEAINPKLILTYQADEKLGDISTPKLEIDLSTEFTNSESRQPEGNFGSLECLRIYTSGSTGAPKIVRLSHDNVSSNFVACSRIVKLNSKDRFLSLLPLSHTFELVGGMLLPLYCGASIALPKVLTAQEVLDAMQEESVSVVLAVPRLYRNIKLGMEKKFREGSVFLRFYVSLLGALPLPLRRWLNQPLRKKISPKLRYWVSGGSRLDPNIAKFYRKLGISLRQGYGMTETSPVIAVQEAFPENLDSVGYVIDGVQVMIDEPNELGSGEVLVKGQNVMLGYTDDELTKQVMKGEWFRTGDIGRLDSSGNLCLTGRQKRIIVTEAGKNVFPEELETLLERYAEVKEAGIVDIENRPAAVLAMEDAEHSRTKAKDIIKDFNAKASSHNRISSIAVVEELPRTPLGKTALSKLKEVFDANRVD